MRYPDGAIGVMARAPIAGQAKTRLIPALGEEGAAELHAYMVERLLGELTTARIAPLTLFCTPDTEHPFFLRCQERYGVSLCAQQGRGLGERIHHALAHGLQSGTAAVVVGCDIPELGPPDLTAAFEALAQGDDAAITPTEDGGYALIGVRRVTTTLFDGIEWGSEKVLAQTQSRLASLGWHWQTLTERWDVDRPQDLRRLAQLPQPLQIQRLLSAVD